MYRKREGTFTTGKGRFKRQIIASKHFSSNKMSINLNFDEKFKFKITNEK